MIESREFKAYFLTEGEEQMILNEARRGVLINAYNYRMEDSEHYYEYVVKITVERK